MNKSFCIIIKIVVLMEKYIIAAIVQIYRYKFLCRDFVPTKKKEFGATDGTNVPAKLQTLN